MKMYIFILCGCLLDGLSTVIALNFGFREMHQYGSLTLSFLILSGAVYLIGKLNVIYELKAAVCAGLTAFSFYPAVYNILYMAAHL